MNPRASVPILGRTFVRPFLTALPMLACDSSLRSVPAPEIDGVAAHFVRVSGSDVSEPSPYSAETVLRVETEDEDHIFIFSILPEEAPKTAVIDFDRSSEFTFQRGGACPVSVVRDGWRDFIVAPPFLRVLELGPEDTAFRTLTTRPAWADFLTLRAPISVDCGVGSAPPVAWKGAEGLRLWRVRYVTRNLVVVSSESETSTSELVLLKRGETRPVFQLSVPTLVSDIAIAHDAEGPLLITSQVDRVIARYRIVDERLEPHSTVALSQALSDLDVSKTGKVIVVGNNGFVGLAETSTGSFAITTLEQQPHVNRVAIAPEPDRYVFGIQGGAVWIGNPASGTFAKSQPSSRTAQQIFIVESPEVGSTSEIWFLDTLGGVRRQVKGEWSPVAFPLPPEAKACATSGEPDACGFRAYDQTPDTLQLVPNARSPVLIGGFGSCTGLAVLDLDRECSGWLGAPTGADILGGVSDSDQLDGGLIFTTSKGEVFEVQID